MVDRATGDSRADVLNLKSDFISGSFSSLYAGAPVLPVTGGDKIVIISDMHIGNRGKGDDFARNSQLCIRALREYYLDRGFTLILNGDIEELHRYTLSEVERAWPDVFLLFQDFADRGRLYKTIGNHDIILPLQRDYRFRNHLVDALRLEFRDGELFVFHGHQASPFQRRFNMADGLMLRLFAKPLGIKSYSVSADRKKQIKVERTIYKLSEAKRIASVIGHTHRPLFESLSKADSLRFDIERLCREYAAAEEAERKEIEPRILDSKRKLDAEYTGDEPFQHRLSVYNSKVVLPCLFNSGCAIGKRGITVIELSAENIALVHWTDRDRGERHFAEDGDVGERFAASDIYRIVLHEEALRYVFARIQLLSD